MKKKTISLETDRLILREIELSDYKDIFKCWTSDPNVTKYVTWTAHMNSNQTKKLVDHWIHEYKKDYTYRWLVTLKGTKEVIGMIDVISKDIHFMTVEVGYCYGSKFWGKGYASEALKEVILYLHSEGFYVVYAKHYMSNVASGKVMKNAGMQYEASLKSRVINKEGNREDISIYSSIKGVKG